MQFADIAAARLHAQHIIQADFETTEAVVSYMGAMQAQDYPGALWSVALRTPGLTSDDVERTLAERKIIRTWPMRGTLHFVAADDARWITQLLAPRAMRAAAARERQLHLDEHVFAKAREIVKTELSGGKQIQRSEFLRIMEARGIQTANQRGYHILWHLAQEGTLCFGPHVGKQPTFVLLDEWIPTSRVLDREAALHELAIRYFTSHGPATLKDFAGWGSMTIADAKRGIELAGKKVAKTTIGTSDYWSGPDLQPANTPSAFLLPGFDEFMLGYKDRTPSLLQEYSSKIVPGNNGVFLPTVVVDGRVVGTWKKTVRKNSIDISLVPFTTISSHVLDLLQTAATRYGKFHGTDAKIMS